MKRAQCPYSELFWSAFSRIQTEHGEILRISPYSVQIQENADQNNSEYGHFSRSAILEEIFEMTRNLCVHPAWLMNFTFQNFAIPPIWLSSHSITQIPALLSHFPISNFYQSANWDFWG